MDKKNRNVEEDNKKKNKSMSNNDIENKHDRNENEINKKKKINNKNTKVKKKFSFKLLIGFIIFELFFTAITAPITLFYGPFETAKKAFVGTAMGSMHYQWLAKTFLSDAQIDKIIGKSEANTKKQNNSLIKVNSSENDNTKVERQTIEGDNYTGIALIISNPYKVHVGVSQKLACVTGKDVGEGQKTSQIAKAYDAIAAINGGSFRDDNDAAKWTQNGGNPQGVIISAGKTLYSDVDRYNTQLDIAAIGSDGKLIVGNYTLEELENKGVQDALNFGPALIIDGKKQTVKDIGNRPKTLIGQRADGAIVLVVLDAKSGSEFSASITEAQDVMETLNCINATNLDGGKSTTMYYDGKVINNPTFATGERKIASGFIVEK